TGRGPRSLDQHRSSITFHQGLAITPDIGSGNVLRSAYGHVVVALQTLATVVIRGKQVVPLLMQEDERTLDRIVAALRSRTVSDGMQGLVARAGLAGAGIERH